MKKFFSAFLLMAAMAFSVGTFVACNDVMDEIEDVKAQTTQNTAAIDALNAEIADLKNELADAQAAADEAMEAAEEAQGTADEALEAAEEAALEAAANAEAIAALIDELEALKTAYEAKVTELETALAGKVDQTEYNAFKAELDTKLVAALERLTTVEGNVNKLLDAERSIKARLDVLESFKETATLDIDALKKDLKTAQGEIEDLWDAVNTNKDDIVTLKADVDAAEELLEEHTQKINDLYEKYSAVAAQVATILARVQSLVNVPEYNNGSSDLRFAKVIAGQDVTYFPGKTTLRYKVNSTDAAIVGKLVAAYEKDNTILSFDLEAVKVRSVEGDATIEIVGVREDEEKGYLLVDVLAMNFVPEFYTGEASYSAALVLVQKEETNNVASEFTNLVPTAKFDVLNLVAKYTGENGEVVVPAYDVHDVQARSYAQRHRIPSQNTEEVVHTTANQPYITVVNDEAYYTVETLYAEYGYKVVLNSTSFVTSFDGDDKHDAPQASAVPAHLCWEVDFNSWNEGKFIVANNTIGASREVSLVEYDREDNEEKVKYDTRVYSYLEVVDAYALGGQQVAVADKVQISKNLVYININADEYKWTLQRAIDLRGANGAYTETLVIEDVPYSNIYDLSPILTGGNATPVYTKLNGVDNKTPIKIRNIVAPTSTVAGTADIWFEVGYEFAAANAEKPNVYTKQWESYLTETTDAVVTLTATLGRYPETVEVNSEVDVTLITEGPNANDFKGYDTLIADAYTELTPANAGFAADAKVNDILYTALVDEANTVVNDPKSAYNLNFLVDQNVDKSTVYLFRSQIENVADVQPAYTFKRTIDTWFNVDFVFNVTAKPQLPKVNLVRSTEYAHATDVEGVYDVNLEAGLVNDVYTVTNSDLAFYLNVIGEAHASQSVSFAVQPGYEAEITNKVTAVDPLDAPVHHPIVGDITAYLKKQNSYLLWNERGTVVKVNATLWAGAYPLDYATLNLHVVDPLTFSTGGNFTVERELKKDTEVQVYKNFTLTSSVKEHLLEAGIVIPEGDAKYNLTNINQILNEKFVTAYDCDIKVVKMTVYEKVTEGEDNPIYDESKYEWNPNTGILTLKKDDVAELINPIEAVFTVTFTHKVHPGAAAIVENIKVTFVQPE